MPPAGVPHPYTAIWRHRLTWPCRQRVQTPQYSTGLTTTAVPSGVAVPGPPSTTVPVTSCPG